MERWLLTYADMITLLMAFFVMMWSMSMADKTKFGQMMGSLRTSLHQDLGGLSLSPLPTVADEGGGDRAAAPLLAYHIREEIGRRFAGSELGESLHVVSDEDSVTIRVEASDVLFARASAELTVSVRLILATIVRTVRDMPYPVRVEGHTCDLPVRSSRYKSNWELSAQRAINVLLYLKQEGKLEADRLSAAGYADSKPVVPNLSEAKRRKNRRVDIKLLNVTNMPKNLYIEQPKLPLAAKKVEKRPAARRPAERRKAKRPVPQFGPIGPVMPPVRIVPPVDIRGG